MQNDENKKINNDEIDLVDFSANREMDRIRENERIEREKRRIHAQKLRRAELVRQKKITAIKRTVLAWAIVIVIAVVIVSGITTLVSVLTDKNDKEPLEVGEMLSIVDQETVKQFSDSKKTVYCEQDFDSCLAEISVQPDFGDFLKEKSSYLGIYSQSLLWNSAFDNEGFEEIVRLYPIFTNGYVWSSYDSMKSPLTNGYFYDTNASFISAVANICLWQGDTSFLGRIDNDGDKNGDVSNGKTVKEKLELAVGHFFDENDVNGGGVRYNKNDKLLYIMTENNGGKSGDAASNIFFNYSFGYLDLYSNLTFNRAMRDLSSLYKLSGDTEDLKKAEFYETIAEENKMAINDKFWDEEKGRFVGCIDVNGNVHDNGFAALNLLAISLGVPNENNEAKIRSWLEEDAYKNPYFPSLTTNRAASSWWNEYNGKYSLTSNAKFGSYWQNGSPGAICGYFDLLSMSSNNNKAERLNMLLKAFKNGNFVLPEKDSDGLSEPALHYGVYMSEAVKSYFGISTDGKVLTIDPAFNINTNIGIKDINHDGKKYSVLYDNDAVFVFGDINSAVKISLDGFEKGESVNVLTVENDIVQKNDILKADKNGVVTLKSRFGDTTFIKIQRQIQEK